MHLPSQKINAWIRALRDCDFNVDFDIIFSSLLYVSFVSCFYPVDILILFACVPGYIWIMGVTKSAELRFTSYLLLKINLLNTAQIETTDKHLKHTRAVFPLLLSR